MKKQLLNDNWRLTRVGEESGALKDGVSTHVPCSVYHTLYENDIIEDPFYRDNELKYLSLMDYDYCFSSFFEISEDQLNKDGLLLCFDGLDTLADIYINDELIGVAFNMHRKWEYNLLDVPGLKVGENKLCVVLHSPTKYIKEQNEIVYTGGSGDCMKGFPHLRKAHCMFGWDWGPRIPDMGIYRDVYILEVDGARIDSVYVTQNHTDKEVTLSFDVITERFCEEFDGDIAISVTSPDGVTVSIDYEESEEIVIENPLLWWPHGYGDQPLYLVTVALICDGEVIDVWKKRIGLRTLTVNTDKDQWGENFAHEINGVQIFAMGADYIPEDNLLPRVSEERTRKLLEDAIWANHNSIRVWGGGYYLDDYFYDICDELGLLVWQDFMFACASYELDDDFDANIRAEVTEVIRRLRHHACLSVWCGNNELETQVLDGAWEPSVKQKADYIKIFDYIIPQIVAKEDPQTFYWPSSPSSCGNFDNPWDENRGDTHYWSVWHGNKPFTEFRKFYFRYLSEFGFQSFPTLKTVETFTKPEERNIFSRVMEMHQRNAAANGKILQYISDTYLYPKNFEMVLYVSQLLQADAISYGIEHNRRYRGRCNGTVVWQLNDIWPVASWSSIDYFGRYKALHYHEKKAFEPIHISCEEHGEIDQRPSVVAEPKDIDISAKLHVANETFEDVSGTINWFLNTFDGQLLEKGSIDVTAESLDGVWTESLDFNKYSDKIRDLYLNFEFAVDGNIVSHGSTIFVAPKHANFANPNLCVIRDGNKITVHADSFAKMVEIYSDTEDFVVSDNFFNILPGDYTVEIESGDPKEIKVRSVYDIA